MQIPVEQFDFEVHEGAYLDICFKLNKKSDEDPRNEISDLQVELLKQNPLENEEK